MYGAKQLINFIIMLSKFASNFAIKSRVLLSAQSRQFVYGTNNTKIQTYSTQPLKYVEEDNRPNPLIEKILKKSEKGRSLAQSVTKAAPLDKFEREQRYEIFINKMGQLYRSQRNFQRKLDKSSKRMRSAHLLYQNPLKETLSEYNKMTTNGFNDELLATSLENLYGVIQAQGNRPIVYTDYTITEMDQSWRMDKVAQDVKFGLTHESVFFSPKNMARSSRALAEIGYKNTEVISAWLTHLQQKLEEDGTTKYTSVPDFESVVYGSMKNFTPRYYVFQGFQDDQEFEQHLQTLMMFKTDTTQKVRANKRATELQNQMQKVIDSAKEIRELQTDQQAAIESLRQQFFKLQAAQNKHEFLEDNKYMMYDMLELQELLVKGGYLEPEEALLGASESIDERMQRASSVFYDVVMNHQPELLSPQYETFYNAATENDQTKKPEVKERHNDLKLGFLSDILVGLAEQAQSYRRDACDKDYPNKFYEDLVKPEESRMDHRDVDPLEKYKQDRKTPYVQMEPSYLNAWTNFSTESGKIIDNHFKRLIGDEKSVDGLLQGLRALSACKYEARRHRDLITRHSLDNLKSKRPQDVSAQAGIDGLMGMAGCDYTPEGSDQLVSRIVFNLNKHKFNYQQKLDLLNAIAMLASKDQSYLDLPLFKKVMAQIDEYVYEAIDNDLTHKQYMQLHVVHQTLKHFNKPSFENKMLHSSLQGHAMFKTRYQENSCGTYDPLKDRVVAGLARGMSDTDLQLMKNQEQFNTFVTDLRLKPDIMTGWKGEQLAIFVLNNRQCMHDTKAADGFTKHMLSLSTGVKPVTVAVEQVVDYDLQNFQLKMKEDFDLNSLLGRDSNEKHNTSYVQYANFCGALTRNMNVDQISGNFDQFISDLAEFFTLKQRLDYLHEPDQLLAANDELKLSLIKLLMLHDGTLSPFEQAQVQKAAGKNSFKKIVTSLRNDINEQHAKWSENKSEKPLDEMFDFNWRGTRQTVELPLTENQTKKAFEPELLSNKFKQNGEYHQYADWKQMMTECYDQFNLMELKTSQGSDVKINYDPADHNRKVPKGIFPLPDRKREVMEQPGVLGERVSLTDRFAKFEQDPHAFMVKQELKISKTLKPISKEVSLITNLQNIKHSLLADYSDKQICQDLLAKLDVTDQLIIEHLNKSKSSKAMENELPRDPAAFRSFMESKPKHHSAFNQFFMKEGLKQTRAKEIYAILEEKQRVFDDSNVEELEDEMERILVKLEKENEDLMALTSSLKSIVSINVDLKSLGVLDQSMSQGTNNSITDAEFLMKERCLAESRLIKSKILYKIDQGQKLSENEINYLRVWKQAMSENLTLMNDCLVPKTPSALKISDMTESDFSVINKIPRVHLTEVQHGKFALNDLVLELSQVFDNQTVRAVELTCLQETMKNDWQLGSEFRLVTKRNKEIDHVLEKYEEVAYRCAGQFNSVDSQSIKDMFLVGRGLDSYDRAFLQKDISSLDDFLGEANSYDSRIQMLETWLCRKEQEIKMRVNLPTPELQISDTKVYRDLEKTYRPARQRLVSAIVSDNKQTKYSQLTSDQLHQVVESLCPRLNLFNREYPVFLPHAVRAIMEHKNLQRSDYATLDAYTKLFNLDWRGDSTIANKDEWLATHPIYTNWKDQTSLNAVGEVNNENVTQALREACQPYLSELAAKVLKFEL